MVQTLARSSSLEGIKKLISEFWYGSTVTLIPMTKGIWKVFTKNGEQVSYKVCEKGIRFIFVHIINKEVPDAS